MTCRSRRSPPTNGPDWHFFGRPELQKDNYYQRPYQGSYEGASYRSQGNAVPQLAVRQVSVTSSEQPRTGSR